MKEELKQAIDKHFISPLSKLGAEKALQDPSILRHADPKVMDDAGWFNKSKLIPETAGLFFPVHCECGWIGSSEELLGGCQIADTGDYGDSYCPACGIVEPSEADELTIEDYKNAIKSMTKIIVGLRDDVEKNYLEKQAGWVREEEVNDIIETAKIALHTLDCIEFTRESGTISNRLQNLIDKYTKQ